MSRQPLTNAAVERIRLALANPVARPEQGRERRAENFSLEDRRTGGLNFGRLDNSNMDAFQASGVEVSRGRMRVSIVEVIAVRGERSAAYVEEYDYGDDTTAGGIMCTRLDPDLRRAERMVLFDLDDRDAAIAELDRMHTEIDD